MRGSHAVPILNQKKQICAIILEGAYCAEHECGIEDILFALNITPLKFGDKFIPKNYNGPWGMERIQYNGGADIAKYLHYTYTKPNKTKLGLTTLVFNSAMFPESYNKFKLERNIVKVEADKASKIAWGLKRNPNNTPAPWEEDRKAEWGKEGFHITTTNPEIGEFLTKAYGAFNGEQPVAVWLGGAGNNPFGRNGLVLGLPNLIDEENKIEMSDTEQNMAKLHWEAEATGIPKLIPSSRYYALRPGPVLETRRNKNIDTPITTQHPVMFFLNPTEQDKNNYGWYTVEELKQWMEGKGPIVVELPNQ